MTQDNSAYDVRWALYRCDFCQELYRPYGEVVEGVLRGPLDEPCERVCDRGPHETAVH